MRTAHTEPGTEARSFSVFKTSPVRPQILRKFPFATGCPLVLPAQDPPIPSVDNSPGIFLLRAMISFSVPTSLSDRSHSGPYLWVCDPGLANQGVSSSPLAGDWLSRGKTMRPRPTSIGPRTSTEADPTGSCLHLGAVKWHHGGWELLGPLCPSLGNGFLGIRPTQKVVKMDKGEFPWDFRAPGSSCG